MLKIDKEKCKGCGLCVAACKKGVLAMAARESNKAGYYPAEIADGSKCIDCALCAIVCPDVVITVQPR